MALEIISPDTPPLLGQYLENSLIKYLFSTLLTGNYKGFYGENQSGMMFFKRIFSLKFFR